MHGTVFGPEKANEKHSFSEYQGVASWQMCPAIPSGAQDLTTCFH